MGYSVKQAHASGEVWEARLQDFLHECVSSAASEEEDRIREGTSLFARMSSEGGPSVDPLAIEAMLACGAGESAVLELIGRDAPFIASRGVGGNCLATLILPDGAEEVIAEGATLALALLAAHAAYVLQEMEQAEAVPGLAGLEGTSRLH